MSDLVFVGLDNIPPHELRISGHVPFKTMRSAASAFQPGDILYGRLRPYLNKVAVADQSGACSGELLVLRPKDGVSARYVSLCIHSTRFVNHAMMAVTGDRPRIDFREVAQFVLPVPDPAVQDDVVARVDALLAKVEEGETALVDAFASASTFRQALLKAAVSGDLSSAWREANDPGESGRDLLGRLLAQRRAGSSAAGRSQKSYREPVEADVANLPALPPSWCWATIDQVSERVTKGSSPGWQGFEYQTAGVLFVRSQNVGWGELLLEDPVYVDPAFNEIERKAVMAAGDVLLNIVGASIGRAAVADDRLSGANSNQAVAGIRLIDKSMSEFVCIWLLSPEVQHRIRGEMVDVARANYSLEQIRSLPMPLPPPAEMEFCVNSFKAGCSAMLSDRERGEFEDQAAMLRQTILSSALKGEL